MAKIKSITKIPKPEIVYNLHVENNHNYIANDHIVSNCHLAKAEVLKQMMSTTFKDIVIRWGLTGTIPKEEHFSRSIFCTIGNKTGELKAVTLQEDGHISNCQVNIIQTTDSIVYNNYQQELKYLLTNEHRMEYMAKIITEICKSGNTLVLVDRKVAGYKLEELIEGATFIHGTTKDAIRDYHYDLFQKQDGVLAIATYGIASVGIDIPRIYNMVLIEPGKSFVRVIQSIGRGLRKAEDKNFVNIYDICSDSKYSKRHLAKRKKFYTEAEYRYYIQKTSY